MLTPDDLKNIKQLLQGEIKTNVRAVVREELEAESCTIKDELSSKILETKMKIINDFNTQISEIKNQINNFASDLKELTEKLETVQIHLELQIKINRMTLQNRISDIEDRQDKKLEQRLML